MQLQIICIQPPRNYDLLPSQTWHQRYNITSGLLIITFCRVIHHSIHVFSEQTRAYTSADYGIKSLHQVWLQAFRGSACLKTSSVSGCLNREVDVLSQVRSESMHHENSSLACNEWVIYDDAMINGKLPSGSLKGATWSTDAHSHYGLGRAGWQGNW